MLLLLKLLVRPAVWHLLLMLLLHLLLLLLLRRALLYLLVLHLLLLLLIHVLLARVVVPRRAKLMLGMPVTASPTHRWPCS